MILSVFDAAQKFNNGGGGLGGPQPTQTTAPIIKFLRSAAAWVISTQTTISFFQFLRSAAAWVITAQTTVSPFICAYDTQFFYVGTMVWVSCGSPKPSSPHKKTVCCVAARVIATQKILLSGRIML
jgi:hypothetical protein